VLNRCECFTICCVVLLMRATESLALCTVSDVDVDCTSVVVYIIAMLNVICYLIYVT